MPGAVPHTSTYALTNVTLPYAVSLADRGWREALQRRSRARARAEHLRRVELVSAPVARGARHAAPARSPRSWPDRREPSARARPGWSGVAEASAYLDHLRVERGVSPHTLAAYRRDLARYAEFLAGRGIVDLGSVDPGDGRRSTPSPCAPACRPPTGAAGDAARWPPSASARAVVAVRSLHRFAVEEGLIAGDPARGVHPPQPARRLPKALEPRPGAGDARRAGTGTDRSGCATGRCSSCSTAPVRGSARPSASTWTTSRDVLGTGRSPSRSRCGCSARAARSGSCRSARTPGRRWTRYLVRARPPGGAGPGHPALFLNARGGRLSRQSAWTILQTRGRAGRDHRRRLAAHPAALLRHPPARRRRRRPGGAGAARPRLGDHHADLHAGHRRPPARGLPDRSSPGALGPVAQTRAGHPQGRPVRVNSAPGTQPGDMSTCFGASSRTGGPSPGLRSTASQPRRQAAHSGAQTARAAGRSRRGSGATDRSIRRGPGTVRPAR